MHLCALHLKLHIGDSGEINKSKSCKVETSLHFIQGHTLGLGLGISGMYQDLSITSNEYALKCTHWGSRKEEQCGNGSLITGELNCTSIEAERGRTFILVVKVNLWWLQEWHTINSSFLCLLTLKNITWNLLDQANILYLGSLSTSHRCPQKHTRQWNTCILIPHTSEDTIKKQKQISSLSHPFSGFSWE